MNEILQGHVLDKLHELPSNSINCIITSPPYYGLRAYGTNPQVWGGRLDCSHEWNNETKKWHSNRGTGKHKEVFDDSFQVKGTRHAFCECGAWRGELGLEPTIDLYIKHLLSVFDECKRVLKPQGTCWVVIGDSYLHAAKSLSLVPFRFAIGMTEHGWLIRNNLIWWKPNCMPASVKDRFTVDFEHVFFFTKNKKYYFNQQFEPSNPNAWGVRKNGTYAGKAVKDYENAGVQNASEVKRRIIAGLNEHGRNARSVWRITTQAYMGAHFAVFPEELVERCLKAGCPEQGVVLDPFIGSGTTALAALKNNRQFLGIELNQEYVKIALERIKPLLE